MVQTTIHAYIPLPLEIVYNHVSSLENMEEYNSSVLKSSLLEKSNNGLPIYSIYVDMGIRKFTGEYIVTERIPNHKIVAYCEQKDLKFTDTYTFKEVDNKTYMEITDVTELRGLLAMSEFLLGPIMKTQMNSNLNRLIGILKERYQKYWEVS